MRSRCYRSGYEKAYWPAGDRQPVADTVRVGELDELVVGGGLVVDRAHQVEIAPTAVAARCPTEDCAARKVELEGAGAQLVVVEGAPAIDRREHALHGAIATAGNALTAAVPEASIEKVMPVSSSISFFARAYFTCARSMASAERELLSSALAERVLTMDSATSFAGSGERRRSARASPSADTANAVKTSPQAAARLMSLPLRLLRRSPAPTGRRRLSAVRFCAPSAVSLAVDQVVERHVRTAAHRVRCGPARSGTVCSRRVGRRRTA